MTSVTLVRHIAAQPSIVFKALSTSEGVAAWWGPHQLPVVSARVDARFGGDYRVRFRTIDGGEHEAHGEFLDVSPPSRLVMTWKYSFGGEPEELGRMSIIEIDLRPVDGGSELTFTHSKLQNDASRSSHEAGWAGALAKLVAQLGHIPG